MKSLRASFLKSLLPLVALLAVAPFAACIDPVVIGGNDGPCNTDAQCTAGSFCLNGICTFQNDGPGCGGVHSPVSCTQNDCFAGEVCVPDMDPSTCHPSSCNCDVVNGWVCTEDCGMGGSSCQPGAPCTVDADCPANSLCFGGGCVPTQNCNGAEVCNGLDDDCDGVVDEQDDPAVALCMDGSACVNGQCGGMTQCGPNVACPPNMFCDATGMCVAVCVAAPESCNGIDDDCDGVVDNATPGAILCPNGGTCVNGSCGGVTPCMVDADCAAGQVCNPNGVCSPGACVPAPESCNGVDDDCDGVIDDATPGTVLCANGATCVNGQCSGVVQCGPNQPCPMGQSCTPNGVCAPGACVPAAEKCDGVDQDCDGVIDNATPGTVLCPAPQICVNGGCSVKQCASNMDCPANTTCQNGLCK